MTEPVAVPMCEEPQTRSDFIHAIENKWFKIHHDTVAICDLLLLAKQRLSISEFKAMVTDELPFGMSMAYRMMQVRLDPKINAFHHGGILPKELQTLEILTRLPQEAFFDHVHKGTIYPDMGREEAKELVRAVRKAIQHRPIATKTIQAPTSADLFMSTKDWPESVPIARTGAQILGETISKRKKMGVSQAEVDQRVNWAEGFQSKAEIPHRDDGRDISLTAYGEMLQALSLGIYIVELEAR